MSRRRRAVGACLLWISLVNAPSARPAGCRRDAIRQLYDTAMEVEPWVITIHQAGEWAADADNVMRLLTTTNGRLSGLIGDTVLPNELRARLSEFGGKLGDISWDQDIAWDQIAPRTQHALIAFMTQGRNTAFFVDRRIRGLELRTQVPVRWDRETTFLGRSYAANTDYWIDISPIVRGRDVEHGTPDQFRLAPRFEVHFRSGVLSAGALPLEVWTLLRGMGVTIPGAHVHVVAPVPKLGTRLAQFRYVDFFRRLNLAAEMISVVEKGFAIHRVEASDGSAVEWDVLSRPLLERLIGDMRKFGRTGEQPAGDPYKFAFVGFHFPKKYDGDTPLVGFQFRSVDRRWSAVFSGLLDATQEALLSGRLGVSRWDAEKYLSRFSHELPLERIVSAQWYRPPVVIGPGPTEELPPPQIQAHVLKNYEVHMITHDWSGDILFQSPEDQRRIADARLAALGQLSAGMAPAHVSRVVRRFLLDSGIYARVMTSVGVLEGKIK